MEAPEKIYLQICGDCNDNDCKNCEFEDLEDNATWCRGKIFKKDIEYTRTDAFIENACEWLENNLLNYWQQVNTDSSNFIEDFRKAMEE